MRSPLSLPHYLLVLLLGFCLLLTTAFVAAQDGLPPAPQFLYRHENHLVLLNGYTGEAAELPIVVSDQNHFAWSPDGQYLMAQVRDNKQHSYCLNLFDVDTRQWTHDKPISCAVQNALFSDDSATIAYSTSDNTNGILWLYSLENETSREVYRTTEGDDLRPAGISDLQWSPTGAYLTFDSYHQIMGGTLNFFVVMNVKNGQYITLSAPNPYYASYHPVWSADDRWFLITLKEEYVTSGSLPYTNDQGDVYLVNAETGEQYRLTYTPADSEYDLHWTEDGQIAFSIVKEQKLTFTLEQAMNVEVVPRDKIVEPEPVNPEDYFDPYANVMMSPDPSLGAWVTQTLRADHKSELDIGGVGSMGRMVHFSVPIPESYDYTNILIGWRPSDYPYPQG